MLLTVSPAVWKMVDKNCNILSNMYAFFPFPEAVNAVTSNTSACKASTDGSSVSISSLALAAKSSLRRTADW